MNMFVEPLIDVTPVPLAAPKPIVFPVMVAVPAPVDCGSDTGISQRQRR